MGKVKLTAATIKSKSLAPGDYGDHIIRGLQLRVSAKDFRSWSVLARGPNGLKRITIGSTSAYSLADAREKAPEFLRAIKEGRDPHAEARERMRERESRLTYAGAVAEYIETELPNLRKEHTDEPYNPRYIKELKRSLLMAGKEGGFDDWSIQKIGKTQLEGLVNYHWKHCTGKPSRARARMRLTAVGNLYSWLVGQDKVADNPVRWFTGKPKPPKPRKSSFTLSELARLWGCADRLSEPLQTYTKLWLLVPLRRSELSRLEFRDVNLDENYIHLPGKKTKNDEDFKIPLSPEAASLLAQRQRETNSLFVFANARTGRPISGWGRRKTQIQKASGTDDWLFHDTRRSFVSYLAKKEWGGFSESLLDSLLNHRQSGTRSGVIAVYQLSVDEDEQARAMERWSQIVVGEYMRAGMQ